MTHTHVTAPTQFIDGNGVRSGYRRFGKETGVAVISHATLSWGLDHWDPPLPMAG